ncbi:hypothetical protein CTA1_7515 [Colletotrichum tanaceti]|uniref:Uncharacterized protein n=1 Tax=Colletotrichum tanaceti TaxID=1306861 RepID=A0A4U6XAP5_9PEZI|nr:hypothetical protein CTA1_7515 [Colletotrichum tanaceti]
MHLSPVPAAGHASGDGGHDAAQREAHAGPHPRAGEADGALEGAADGGAEQQGDGHDGVGHAEAGADVVAVGGELGEGGGLQGEEAAAAEAVEDKGDDEAGGVADGHEAEGGDGHDEHGDDEQVHAAEAVGEQVRQDAAEDGGAVHDGQQGEALDVDKGRVHGQEDEAAGRHEEEVGGVGEGGPVDPGPPPPRRLGRVHAGDGHALGGQRHQGHGPHRPGEADLGLEEPEEDGQYQTRERERNDEAKRNSPANTTPRGGDAKGHGKPRGEPGRQDGDAQDGQAAHAGADAEPLRQEQLQEAPAEALGDGADDDEQGAGPEQLARVAQVEDGAGEAAQEDHQEALQGADGGDGEGGVLPQQVGLVVDLEDAEAGDETCGGTRQPLVLVFCFFDGQDEQQERHGEPKQNRNNSPQVLKYMKKDARTWSQALEPPFGGPGARFSERGSGVVVRWSPSPSTSTSTSTPVSSSVLGEILGLGAGVSCSELCPEPGSERSCPEGDVSLSFSS